MKLKQRITQLVIICTTLALLLCGNASIAADTPTAATPTPAKRFTPEQVKSIQSIVHEYLVKNPEVLLQASIALRKKMQDKQQQQSQTAIKQNVQPLFNDPNNPTAGNPQGDVILVEFFDYQCPHCKEMITTIDNIVKENKNVKIVFKEWPIFGGNSLDAAKAALAANEQGKYFVMHNALLAAKNPLTKEKILALARKNDLNIPALKKAMDSKKIADQIKNNFTLARKLGLVGTPAFVLTNKQENTFEFIPGATTQAKLQSLIKKLS